MSKPAAAKVLTKVATRQSYRFTVMSYNVLCPSYFRVSGRTTESNFPHVFRRRHARILATIFNEFPDVVCLQEYWFHASFYLPYRKALGDDYHIFTLQRTGGGADGVCILVNKRSAKVWSEKGIHFKDAGLPQDRVALMLIISPIINGTVTDYPLAIINTHLTYPHTEHDKFHRLTQAHATITSMKENLHLSGMQGMPTILAGDFNMAGGASDAVYQYLEHSGFHSTYDSVNGHPAHITHCDHHTNQLPVDFIWQKNSLMLHRKHSWPEWARTEAYEMEDASCPLASNDVKTMTSLDQITIPPKPLPLKTWSPPLIQAVSSTLLPRDVPADTPMTRPVFDYWRDKPFPFESLTKSYLYKPTFQDWCSMSDHRPVLTEFEITYPRGW